MKRHYHSWTTREVKLLRDLYPAGGVRACVPHLAGLNKSAIYAQVRLLGLRRIYGRAITPVGRAAIGGDA